jgi:Mrp family chromosome partitioning ATPase/uncharacterized protein involved in exopolysaccharide biosynthesis
MTSQHSHNGDTGELMPASSATGTALREPMEPEPAAGPQEHPLKKLHRLLRGRYVWAILLGGLLGTGGAVGGWMLITPMHEARGQIAIKTYVPRIMYKTEETGRLPMAEKFVGNQVKLVQSSRVVTKAMESEQWAPYSEGLGPKAVADFRDSLQIQRPRGTDVINVRFTHANEKAARAAVQSVISAYEAIFKERESQEDEGRFAALSERRSNLQDQINSLSDRIQNVAGDYGPDTLRQMYEFQLQEVQQLEQELRRTEVALASAGVALDQSTQSSGSDANAGEADGEAGQAGGETDGNEANQTEAQKWAAMSVREIARLDGRMSQLLDQKQSLSQQIDSLTATLGERHRRVQDLRAQLRSVQQSIDQYAKQFREEGPSALSNQSGRSTAEMSVQQLRAKRKQLSSLLKQARGKMRQLGEQHLQVSDLQQQRANLEERLAQTKQRIEQLNLESDPAVSGRIVINNEGQIQPGIVNDGTRKQMAVLGLMGGGGLGVGFILLLGWRDRRLENPDDMTGFAHQPRVLGMLPNLPKDLADPQNANLAAYAVHHIRSMLQLVSSPRNGHTLAVTGPGQGSGKTSLTLGLGLSFASANCRTLLVDCDLASGGLSRRLQTFIRRRLGQILQREGRLSQEQLEQALAVAERDDRRIGEVLMETGAIDEQTLASALDAQEKQSVGLLDALAGEPLGQCVADSGLDNLSVLPIGDAGAADMSRLSPQALKQVIDAAREQFEVVLIDTGPMPGAVESGIAAGVADQAVMVVTRGQQQPEVEHSLSVLHSIRVPLAGVVFNRANQRDLERSGGSSSMSKLRGSSSKARSSNGHPNLRTDRFDPVTRAVASAQMGEANGPSTNGKGTGATKGNAKNKQKQKRRSRK